MKFKKNTNREKEGKKYWLMDDEAVLYAIQQRLNTTQAWSAELEKNKILKIAMGLACGSAEI